MKMTSRIMSNSGRIANAFSRFASSTLVALAIIGFTGTARAQTLLEVATIANGGQAISTQLGPDLVGGVIAPLSYGFPPQGPGLTIRPLQPMLCARVGSEGSNPLKKVVFDPNGYFAPIPLASESFVEGRGQVIYGAGAFLRGSDAIDFSSSAFVTVDGQMAFDINGVRGYCFLVPAVDVPPSATTCATVSEPEESVFGGSFESEVPGTLQITATSHLQPPLNNELSYQYVLRATGGSVFDIRLREQFPYFSVQTAPSEPGVFARSLALEENWSCEASAGAKCDLRGARIDGAGYIHLDGGRIPEGGCLKITTTRDLRINGTEQTTFSGRLHAGAVYTKPPTSQLPAATVHTSIRQVFATE
jgi:hypothetical protein